MQLKKHRGNKFLRCFPRKMRAWLIAQLYKKVFNLALQENHILAERTVFIIQPTFFDLEGQKCFYGGAERYVLDIAALCRKEKLSCVLLQYSSNGMFFRKEKDCFVFGVPTLGHSLIFYLSVLHLIPNTAYKIIYSWSADVFPMKKNSLLLSHGIFWDSFKKSPEEEQRLLDLKKHFSQISSLISVDANTISWIRSTWPSLARCKPMYYLPNYADCNIFSPAERPEDRIHILFPRRATMYRGYWLMSKAAQRILLDFPNTDLFFIGFVHENDIAQDMKRLKEKFPNRVMQAAVSPDEMPSYYQKSHIVVIPTVHSEGTSLSCLEAMASECAVIASNVGGLSNIVINNYNGILINPDEEELYQALKTLISDGIFRKQLAKRAREVVKISFNKQNWEQTWRTLLVKDI